MFASRILIVFLLGFFMPSSLRAGESWPQPKPGFSLKDWQEIAVLENGRKKPLDTFAREAVRSVTGRETFHGFEASELLLSWLTQASQWEGLPILDAAYQPLNKQVQLQPRGGRVSPKELIANPEFQIFVEGVRLKQQEKQKLTELEKNAAAIQQRANLFFSIAAGTAFSLFPQSSGPWLSLEDLSKKFPDLESLQQNPSLEGKTIAALQGALSSYYQDDPRHFAIFTQNLKQVVRQQGESVQNYPSATSLTRELHFNRLRPFRWTWVIYSLAFFFLLSSLWLRGSKLYLAGMALLTVGFLLHAYGFFLRIAISGRAPVTNMYETVIWVSFGVILFSLIFEAIYRAKYYGTAASAVAVLLLVLADSVPSILDPAIHPLVPVLRSNYWLTIHVLTITLSYAAFALALGVGNVSLGYYIFRPHDSQRIDRLNYLLYRAVQVGVVLLATGTILGGVWANASWGRFWGWDPKEVWALIALLGYLSILHGRHAGWLRGFGLAVGSVLAFLLVIMAWYGVNFILGVGLHSYGFSSGGAKGISLFVLAEILWLGFAALRFKAPFKPLRMKPTA
jgi:ABC-type transport system involved in cytochrome c biogenesis, permease component